MTGTQLKVGRLPPTRLHLRGVEARRGARGAFPVLFAQLLGKESSQGEALHANYIARNALLKSSQVLRKRIV